jgi:AraC-like DNA-binding protein
MSYNSNLILDNLLQKVRQAPSRSLDSISREMRVSRRTLENVLFLSSRKRFKKIQGEILLAIVQNTVLAHPSLTIKELAFSLGYASPRTFARAIKRVCGMSPVELRTSIAQRTCSTTQLEISSERSSHSRGIKIHQSLPPSIPG